MRPDGSSGLCIDHADIYVHGERGIRRPNCSRGNYIHLQLGSATKEGKMGVVCPARTVQMKICDAH